VTAKASSNNFLMFYSLDKSQNILIQAQKQTPRLLKMEFPFHADRKFPLCWSLSLL